MTPDLRTLPRLLLPCALACGQAGSGDTLTASTTGDSSTAASSGHATGGSTTAPTTAPTTGGSTTGAPTTGEPTTGDVDPCTVSPQALADCVDPAAYEADLQFIADVRVPGTPHWQAVQDLCADRLTELGYEVTLHDYGTGTNVVGRRLGAVTPGEIVVVAAHYDHISDCRGADDNASGVAGALEIARLLAKVEFERTVHVACWDEEELGLIGAEAYVAAAVNAGDDIVINFNFDMIGFASAAPNSQTVPEGFELVFPAAYAELQSTMFRGDFLAIIANAAAHEHAVSVGAAADRIALRPALIELPEGTENSELFADLRRSDHAAFWGAGFPAVFLTDTGEFRNLDYHCLAGTDEVADLDLDFATAVTRATVEAGAVALGM